MTTKSKTMRKKPLNLHIPEAIAEAAKDYAASRGESVSSVVRRLLLDFLEEEKRRAAVAAQDAIASRNRSTAA